MALQGPLVTWSSASDARTASGPDRPARHRRSNGGGPRSSNPASAAAAASLPKSGGAGVAARARILALSVPGRRERRGRAAPRSARATRDLHLPNGYSGELRAVFSTGGACWGVACLTRREGEPDFTRAEAEFVGSLCDHVAHGLRSALLLAAVDAARPAEAPGMIVLAADGAVESISAQAEALLAELEPGRMNALELPDPVHAVALRARHAGGGDEHGVPRARVATQSGRWPVLHAACLRDRRDRRRPLALPPHRARARQGDLRQGRRREPA